MSGICNYRRFIISTIIILGIVVIVKVLNSNDSKFYEDNEEDPSLITTTLSLAGSNRTSFLQFKKLLKSYQEKDPYLEFDVFVLNWLQAADYDVEKAKNLLNENLAWKKENNIYSIQEEGFSDMSEFEIGINQVDIKGRPVLFINMGAWNIKKAVKSGTKDRLLRHITKYVDEVASLVYAEYAAEKNITQYVLLVQLEDFNVFNGICVQCMSVYVEIAKLYEEKYPRLGNQIIFINTPEEFSTAISVFKSILSEHNQKSMFSFESKNEWGPWLSELEIQNPSKVQSEEDPFE